MTRLQRIQQGDTTCWYDATLLPEFEPACFEPAWWLARHAVTGQSHGRNVTWFVQGSQCELVLRHYWRGGLLRNVLRDRFLYLGPQRTRSREEYALLTWLRDMKLPVPRPIAARVVRHGLCYRADILLERIPDSRDLVSILRERPLTTAEWQRTGRVICQMHDMGAWHSDLNAHNLMLDGDGKVWVIDFDKCGIREPGLWQDEMLQRLLRSLRKEAVINVPFFWQEEDWAILMAAYRGEA